jgi:hypothetical protein
MNAYATPLTRACRTPPWRTPLPAWTTPGVLGFEAVSSPWPAARGTSPYGRCLAGWPNPSLVCERKTRGFAPQDVAVCADGQEAVNTVTEAAAAPAARASAACTPA